VSLSVRDVALYSQLTETSRTTVPGSWFLLNEET